MKDTKGAQDLRNLVSPPRVSQQEVAEACGVSQQAVSSWMQHRSKPTPDRMRILKDRFGIPMESWTEDPDPESPPAGTPNSSAA